MLKDNRGVTLIELLVTIAIVAILAAVAAPNIGPWMEKRKLNDASRNIVSSINLARNEAMNRNKTMDFVIYYKNDPLLYKLSVNKTTIGVIPDTALPKNVTISKVSGFTTSVTTTAIQFNSKGYAVKAGYIIVENPKAAKSNNKKKILINIGGAPTIE